MNINEFVLQNGEVSVLLAVKESLLKKAERLKKNQYSAYFLSASKSVQEAIDCLNELDSYFRS